MSIEQIIKKKKFTIIDVRSHCEYLCGNVKNSLNIPLKEIQSRIDEFKQMQQPLVICCASGARSLAAKKLLNNNNIDCYDAGSWLKVNSALSKNN